MILTEAVKARILGRIGALVRDQAKRKCPVDDGLLRNSIEYEVRGNSVFIFSEVKYAAYVEYGTGVFHLNPDGSPEPHLGWDVVPVDQEALRFEPGRKERLAGGGEAEFVFAKKVHVEGMHAQSFLRPALFESEPRFAEIIREELHS